MPNDMPTSDSWFGGWVTNAAFLNNLGTAPVAASPYLGDDNKNGFLYLHVPRFCFGDALALLFEECSFLLSHVCYWLDFS
jgi:hypothetical protein